MDCHNLSYTLSKFFSSSKHGMLCNHNTHNTINTATKELQAFTRDFCDRRNFHFPESSRPCHRFLPVFLWFLGCRIDILRPPPPLHETASNAGIQNSPPDVFSHFTTRRRHLSYIHSFTISQHHLRACQLLCCFNAICILTGCTLPSFKDSWCMC